METDMDRLGRDMDKFERTHKKIMNEMQRENNGLLWIGGAVTLISLALTGGMVYVAAHFIAKYW